ncbi:MAG: DUF4255 domain-containing protein [Candidatus Solibacter sp.]
MPPPTGVNDLSIITDRLIAIVRSAITAAAPGFPFVVSGSMPESVRAESGGCKISLYLYYVGIDPSARNSNITGPEISRQRPLGLELYYLLTAFSGKEYVQEQHALTIAMRALQDTPFLRLGGGGEELTVTLSMEGIDKLGILWQAVSAPFRLTSIYKVAIAFISPSDPTPAPAKKPTVFTLTADPTGLPFAESGQLMGTHARVTYMTPDSTPQSLQTRTYDLSPAAVAPGQRFSLIGGGIATANQLFLLDADGANESDVTAWKAPAPAVQTTTAVLVDLPAGIGAVPANSPLPGVYQLRSGAGTARTNSVPVSIAPALTGVANPPILAPVAGVFTVNGLGFVSGKTEVLLDAVAMTEAGGPPAAGEFQIGAGGTTLAFQPPANLAPGRFGLRVRVSGVESAPSWWVLL